MSRTLAMPCRGYAGISSGVFPLPPTWRRFLRERESKGTRFVPELRGVEDEGFSSFAFSKYDVGERERAMELSLFDD